MWPFKIKEVLTVADSTAADVVKTGVDDFEKALKFVEESVTMLGDASKDVLIQLAKKYF